MLCVPGVARNWVILIASGDIRMKFRTKLLIGFLAVALVSNGLAMVLMYSLSKHYLFESFRSKVLTVASTTAALLDGDLHRDIRSRIDENSPAYLKLKE